MLCFLCVVSECVVVCKWVGVGFDKNMQFFAHALSLFGYILMVFLLVYELLEEAANIDGQDHPEIRRGFPVFGGCLASTIRQKRFSFFAIPRFGSFYLLTGWPLSMVRHE